ncbi:MAG: DNA-3-methyladenine glycosylase I [Planctomycetota bacterium]|jgi:DNA-3-methyladenine glycosylase I
MGERCEWAGGSDGMRAYHDDEWGVPDHEDKKLFEMLTLEGAQAGLSWQTILNKRVGYRRLFEGFDPARIARFGDDDTDRLLQDAGIVRHRGKIESTIGNARAVLVVQEELGSFDRYIWDFVDGTPIVNRFANLRDIPAQTDLSKKISKDLKRRGFRFVGPTTVYAFMQAAGLVNDHVVTCERWAELAR